MAGALENPNQVQEFLGVLKRRLWTLVLPVVYLGVIGSAIALFLPKKYEVDITLNVLEARVDDPGRLDANAQQTAVQRELPNAESHVKQHRRIRQVIEELGWEDYLQQTGVEQNEYIERVAKNLDVKVTAKQKDEGSTFIDITYKDTDRNRAETFLNTLAPRWLVEISEQDINNQVEAAKSMRGLVEDEDLRYRTAEEEIIEIQQLFSITPAQPGIETRFSSDPIEEQLKEAESRLSAAEAERDGALAELESIREAMQAQPLTIDVENTPERGAIQTQMAKLRTQELAILAERKGLREGASSSWWKSERNLTNVRDQMAELEDEMAGLESTFEEIPNPARQPLELKETLLIGDIKGLDSQIARTRSEVFDLDIKQKRRTKAMGDLREKQNQATQAKTKAEGHLAELAQIEENIAMMRALGTPYVVTKSAVSDVKPNSPNVPLIIVGSLLAGLAIGIGLTALLEFARPGFRTPSDAVRALTVPVLGVVDHISTHAERVRSRTQRALVGFSTLILLGGLVWISWAWHQKPELLGTDLAHALDELHESLK